MKVVIGALELDPSKVARSAKSVPAEHGPQTDRGRLEKLRRWDQRTWTQEPSEQSPSMTKWLMPSRIAPLERNRWWLIGRLTRFCKRQSDSLTHRCEKRFFCVSRETFLMRKSRK